MKREGYWDYMGRKIRESRQVMLTDRERIEDLERRVAELESLTAESYVAPPEEWPKINE